MPVRAIAFDCFGTLVRITAPVKPFAQLIRHAPLMERREAATAVMTHRWSLQDTAKALNILVTSSVLIQLEASLTRELASVECFPETLEVLVELRRRGYTLALCSNLAQPYAEPVTRLLGHLVDATVWSFAEGFVKPDRRIYEVVSERLALPPEQVLMVGDTKLDDCIGARDAGLQAIHLTRLAPPSGRMDGSIANLRQLLFLV